MSVYITEVTIKFRYQRDTENYKQLGKNNNIVDEEPTAQACDEIDKAAWIEDPYLLGEMLANIPGGMEILMRRV